MPQEKALKRLKMKFLHNVFDYQGEQQLPPHIHNAVIFIARHIGDTMAVYPAVRALQKAHVNAITIVANPSSYAALAPLAEEGIQFIKIPHERDRKSIKVAAKQIRDTYGQVELCIQAMTRDTTATMLFQHALKARCNLGLHRSPMRMYIPHVATQAIKMMEDLTPAPFCWAQLMEDAGIADVDPCFELPIPEEIEKTTLAQISNLSPYIALNLDSSQAERSLSDATAIQLVEVIHSTYGYPVVIICAPAGENRARRLASSCPSTHVAELPRSIYHSAAIIKHAALVISPDTSIVHIASAYNRPTIGIYRFAAKAWPPLADRHALIITDDDINNIDMSVFKTALDTLLAPSV